MKGPGRVSVSLFCVRILVVVLAVVATVEAGIILEPMQVPPADDAVWALASRGQRRYAGGWFALDRPIPGTAAIGLPEQLVALRVGTRSLGRLLLTDRLFARTPGDSIPTLDRFFYGWSLRVPVFPVGPVRLQLTERSLLTPEQIRISLDGLEPEEADPEP